MCVNRHLLNDLIKRGLWTDELKNKLIAHNGSVQSIEEIPLELKNLYKTVWEIKIKTLIDMAADRGAFIDQSQSFNVHMTDVSFAKLTSMHFYAWKKGLKTGMYYLRSQAAANAIKFTVDAQLLRSPSSSLTSSTSSTVTPTTTSSLQHSIASSSDEDDKLQNKKQEKQEKQEKNRDRLSATASAAAASTSNFLTSAKVQEKKQKKQQLFVSENLDDTCTSCGS